MCVQVCKAQALYMCGEAYKHAAAQLVSQALHRNPEHEGALLEYVRIVMDRELFADAMRILLRLLVNSHERTTIRQASSLALQMHIYWTYCRTPPKTSVMMLDAQSHLLLSWASCTPADSAFLLQ